MEAEHSHIILRIEKHGCWCSKLNKPADLPHLGGEPLDGLDRLCKQWFLENSCASKNFCSDNSLKEQESHFLWNGNDQNPCQNNVNAQFPCRIATCNVDK